MVALAACLDNHQRVDIIRAFSLKKREKPNFSKTLEFFNAGELEKLSEDLPALIKDMEDIRNEMSATKANIADCKIAYDECAKLSGGLKRVINIIDKFQIDNITLQEIVNNIKQLQTIISEIKDIAGIYIEVAESQKDFINGNTLTHEEVWEKK